MPLEGHPANGLVVRNEDNIQIEKENLYIRRTKIEVSYVFKNLSEKEIVTDVAFPIPPHKNNPSGIITYPIYHDFKVEVNGAQLKYDVSTRALVNGKDVTDILNSLNFAINVFGFPSNFDSLNKAKIQELIDLGIIERDLESEAFTGKTPIYAPAWSVATTYYWKQVFPAKSSISTKIQYTPNPSETNHADNDREFINRRKLANPYKAALSDLLCLNDDLKKWDTARDTKLEAFIVDYILTTANHWKRPIKEFNLVIESEPATRLHERASTCFESGKLKKISETRYQITINDFVPKEELSVFFLSYAHARNVQDSLDEYLYRCAYHIRGKPYDGDKRYYSTDDLQQWLNKSADDEPKSKQLCIKSLRNEIYARHGRIFTTPEMKQIFESASWYNPRTDFKESDLSEIEKKNVEFISSYEKKMDWR
jgi:hypothetical protein